MARHNARNNTVLPTPAAPDTITLPPASTIAVRNADSASSIIPKPDSCSREVSMCRCTRIVPAGCGVTSIAADIRAPSRPTDFIRSCSNGREIENSRPAASSNGEAAIDCSNCANCTSVCASRGPATLRPSARRSIVGAVPVKKMSSISVRASSGSNGPSPPNAACTAATSVSSSVSLSVGRPSCARWFTHDSSSSFTNAWMRSRLPTRSSPAYRAPSADSRAATRCCTSVTAAANPSSASNGAAGPPAGLATPAPRTADCRAAARHRARGNDSLAHHTTHPRPRMIR